MSDQSNPRIPFPDEQPDPRDAAPCPVTAQELPACAAIQFKNGIIIAGKRHDVCIKSSTAFASRNEIAESVQGFMTTRGRFVGREEGWKLAVTAGMVIEVDHPGGKVLFSEDLY